jgi:hypothetical protein
MYSFIRTQHNLLKNGTISEILADNIPVSTAIWYLEELAVNSSKVPKLDRNRLNAEAWTLEATKVTESFGKLLERILRFKSKGWKHLANDMKSAASNRLLQLQEEFSDSEGGSSTVVFGDASSSMQTAIEAATIIATMASIFWNAELSFFHSTHQASPHPRPTTVDQALDVCSKIRAIGCTSLAAALMPYYKRKIPIDRIILVTDEQENTICEGYNFARLLEAYKKQVKKDVELIIIGVGSLYRPFHLSLENSGIEFKRVEIDKCRPDLTKFDDMLRQVALMTTMTKKDNKEITDNDEETDFVLL